MTIEPAQSRAGKLRFAGTLTPDDGKPEQLWWELPEAWADAVAPWADPWVVGFVFQIMERQQPVHVAGRVSPSLLANLENFMKIWEVWSLGHYRPVTITADEEKELPPVPDPGLGIVAFSCGVDSCFTVYQHMRGLAGRRTRRLAAGVMQHGFDVELDQFNAQGIHDDILAGASTILGSVGLPCIPLTTNFRQLSTNWEDAWGVQLVSGLSLLAGRYDTVLVANDQPYAWLWFPWAHHPLTAPFLSSNGFTVIDDGGECSRADKAAVIADWPEAMQHLRVCFGAEVPGRHENCCRCEKCARTLLSFRVAKRERPAAFKREISDREVRALRWQHERRTWRWQEIADAAEKSGQGHTSWAKALRAVVRINRLRQFRNRLQRPFVPLRDAIRRVFRGSPMSKSEMAARVMSRPRMATGKVSRPRL